MEKKLFCCWLHRCNKLQALRFAASPLARLSHLMEPSVFDCVMKNWILIISVLERLGVSDVCMKGVLIIIILRFSPETKSIQCLLALPLIDNRNRSECNCQTSTKTIRLLDSPETIGVLMENVNFREHSNRRNFAPLYECTGLSVFSEKAFDKLVTFSRKRMKTWNSATFVPKIIHFSVCVFL